MLRTNFCPRHLFVFTLLYLTSFLLDEEGETGETPRHDVSVAGRARARGSAWSASGLLLSGACTAPTHLLHRSIAAWLLADGVGGGLCRRCHPPTHVGLF